MDFSRLPPGAFCSVLLGDLGADVIRVESPRGRTYTGPIGLHRGKRSIAIDLRHQRANELLRSLVAGVDVVIENEVPGVMDRRGFGYSQASQEAPSLIWCSITGYGQDGPYASWPGHDLSYVAHSGLLSAVNPDLPWQPQLIMSIPAGALMATVGILSALRNRDRDGAGCQIDISLSESAMWLLSSSDGLINDGPAGIPEGPDRRIYGCADDTWIAVTAAEPRTWSTLCEKLGLPEYSAALHQWDEPNDVTERLAAIFLQRPADAWVAELGPAGAAVVRANRGRDLPHDPQIQARGALQQVGDVLVPRSPVRFRRDGTPVPAGASFPPTPAGSDTRAVLSELGMDQDEIADLEAAGVIGKS